MKLNPIGPVFQRIRNQKQRAERGAIPKDGEHAPTDGTSTEQAADPRTREQIRRARSIVQETPKVSTATDQPGKEATGSILKRTKSEGLTRKSSVTVKKSVTIQALDVETKREKIRGEAGACTNISNGIKKAKPIKEDAGICTDTSDETREEKPQDQAATGTRGLEKQVMYKEFLKRIAEEHAEQNTGRGRSAKQSPVSRHSRHLDHDDSGDSSHSTADDKSHQSPADYVLSFLTENAICSPCLRTTGTPRKVKGNARASKGSAGQSTYSISLALLDRIKSLDETYYTMESSRASSNMRSLVSEDDSLFFSDEETGTSVSSGRLSDSEFPNPCVVRQRTISGLASV